MFMISEPLLAISNKFYYLQLSGNVQTVRTSLRKVTSKRFFDVMGKPRQLPVNVGAPWFLLGAEKYSSATRAIRQAAHSICAPRLYWGSLGKHGTATGPMNTTAINKTCGNKG